MIGGITLGIIALGFLCCIWCGFKSLKMAIDVIDAAADFLNKTKRVLLVPVLYFFVTLFIVLMWCGMMVCVVSLNEIVPSKTIPQFKSIKTTSEFNYWSLWYMVFGLIWLLAFIEYKSQFIVQVSAASYYFDSNANKDGSASVGMGFKFAYLNHIGSLAFGSFVIGLLRLAKLVFVYAA
jgi:hypothetical protein